jgi:predicted flap endonuclease-1-like 5' DNA nuclease
MSRFRTIVLLGVAALLVLWLRPWRRLRRAAPGGARPQWFSGPARGSHSGDGVAGTARSYAAGFSSGLTGGVARPGAPAQPAAPPAEEALDALESSPAATSAPAEKGPLPFEVLDDMQGQHAAEARTGAPSADAAGPAPQEASGEQSRAVGAEQHDDLMLIEGIGPRANLVMQGAGITSFAQLAATDAERLRQILRDNGIEVLNPTTWPEQAGLAAEGHLDELRELQGRIKNGRIEQS